MKTIIVLADTHIPKKAKQLPSHLLTQLTNVDLIIHAGDLQSIEVIQKLSQYAPIYAVYGNVDSEEVKNQLDDKIIIQVEEVKIGIIHGHGRGKTTEKRVLDAFKNVDLDVIIFGHSHIPIIKQVNHKWLFNPGSPTDRRKQPHFSYGLMTVNGCLIDIKHLFFD